MVVANTEDGGKKTVPLYEKGTDVFYRNAAGVVPAHILSNHLDDLLDPYYSIRLEDGREKQTDNAHINLTREGFEEEDRKKREAEEADRKKRETRKHRDDTSCPSSPINLSGTSTLCLCNSIDHQVIQSIYI